MSCSERKKAAQGKVEERKISRKAKSPHPPKREPTSSVTKQSIKTGKTYAEMVTKRGKSPAAPKSTLPQIDWDPKLARKILVCILHAHVINQANPGSYGDKLNEMLTKNGLVDAPLWLPEDPGVALLEDDPEPIEAPTAETEKREEPIEEAPPQAEDVEWTTVERKKKAPADPRTKRTIPSSDEEPPNIEAKPKKKNPRLPKNPSPSDINLRFFAPARNYPRTRFGPELEQACSRGKVKFTYCWPEEVDISRLISKMYTYSYAQVCHEILEEEFHAIRSGNLHSQE